MIGLTGATSRLGQAIMRLYPGVVVPIGRVMPAESLPVIIHAATIRGRSESDAAEFMPFNDCVAEYATRHGSKVVNVGSCWQLLAGTCQDQPYTRLKNQQEALLPGAVHVYPYHIYGPSKGFVYEVKRHLQGGSPLGFVGTFPLDLVYVDDVARACVSAVGLPTGRYAIASGIPTRPLDLLNRYGLSAPVRDDVVTSELAYPLPIIGNTLVTVDDYLQDCIKVV